MLSADVLGFHDMMWERKGPEMSSPMMSVRVWASRQIFELPASGVFPAAQEPGGGGCPWHSLTHRWVPLPQRAPPLCCSHHPCSLPYILTFCAHGYRTLRNQFTGKQGKAENWLDPKCHVSLSCAVSWARVLRGGCARVLQSRSLLCFSSKAFAKLGFFQTTLSEVESDVSQ